MAASESDITIRRPGIGSRVFNRYTLLALLGRGGMGEVYRARDETLGTDIALKFVSGIVCMDAAGRSELKQETLRSRELTHRNIVRIHDFVEDEHHAAITMELVEGTNLTELRVRRPEGYFEADNVAQWLPELCEALDYAHLQAKLVHRDLKPSNILLARDGTVKVTDFGVARQLIDSATRVSSIVGGTLVYMSPQQAMGETASPADDIYSLGATLYELLTGKPPFHTGDVRMQLERRSSPNATQRRIELNKSARPLPGEWEETLRACLDKNPAKRPATAGEVARRLGLAGGKPPGWKPARKRLRLPLILGAASLLLVGALLWSWKHETALRASGPREWPSDKTRALGAWNMDGNGLDSSGHGLHAFSAVVTDAYGNVPIPVRDRNGRLDRALHFTGTSVLTVKNDARLCWPARTPFTVAVWVRPSESFGCALLRLIPKKIGENSLNIRLIERYIEVVTGPLDRRPLRQVSNKRILPDQWSHVAVVFDGNAVAIFINGEAASTGAGEGNLDAATPTTAELHFASNGAFIGDRFTGELDDMRLWPRALPHKEIQQSASPATAPRFRLTRLACLADNDYDTVAKEDFGPTAKPADWSELAAHHDDDVLSLCDDLGLPEGKQGTFHILKDGDKYWEDQRAFWVTRYEGQSPSGNETHEELGGMRLSLGSWYGAKHSLCVRLPAAQTQTQTLAAKPGEAARILIEESKSRDTLAVRWATTLRREDTRDLRATFILKNKQRIGTRIRRAASGGIALDLGTVDAPQRRNEVGSPVYETLHFSFIAKNGSLHLRALNSLGGVLSINEVLELTNLRCVDIAAVEVQDIESAEITTEQ